MALLAPAATPPRDLIGYAGRWPDMCWPNGARLAVSLVLNVEEGAETTHEAGDGRQEVASEVASVSPPDRRDLGVEEIFGYGLRAGVWRFADAFDRHRMPATLFICGRAARRCPEAVRMLVARGHEPACHGWRWLPHSVYDDPTSERAELEAAVAAIRDAAGVAPQGFFCRAGQSPWTRGLLKELGFVYCSNAFDDDLPYWTETPGGPLLAVPYALDTNDMKFWHPNGFTTAAEFATYVDDALTVLLREAEAGYPRLLNIGFHLRICGRPARFAAVDHILARLAACEDRIWIASRIDIARHWSAILPPRRRRPENAVAPMQELSP